MCVLIPCMNKEPHGHQIKLIIYLGEHVIRSNMTQQEGHIAYSWNILLFKKFTQINSHCKGPSSAMTGPVLCFLVLVDHFKRLIEH